MKNPLSSACIALLSLAIATPCFAASSPWDGTWKLNEAKSKMTGETFTLTALPNGGFHLSQSDGIERDYTCDGKDYPTIAHYTGTCIKVDDHHYKMAGKIDGKPAWDGTSVVSPDNKFLTNTATEHRLDGTSSTDVNKYERVGKGTGRAGTWKNVKSSNSISDVTKYTLTGNTLRIEDPAHKDLAIARLDGTPAILEGPDSSPDLKIMLKTDGPYKLIYHQTYKGKPMDEGYETVSADGKIMTQVMWNPGKPDTKQTYVYEKQ